MLAASGVDRRAFQTQAGKVYDHLWELISSGGLGPGDSVSLRSVAARLRTSIAPVRDALALLAERGVAEKAPKYGYRVRGLTRDDIVGYFTMRRAILGESARLAAERVTDDQIAELRELAAEADDLIKGGDYKAASPLDNAFHRGIAAIAGVPKLVEEIARLEMPAVFLPPRSQGPHAHLHVQVLEALATRNPLRADEEMRAHVDWAFRDTLASWEAMQREDPASGHGQRSDR